MIGLDEKLRRLVETLRALAIPAEAQLRLLPPFVCRADELALNFADAALFLPELMEGGQVSSPQAAPVERVSRALQGMSGARLAHLWSDGALIESPEWATIRDVACQALTSLGASVRVPSLDWLMYVERRGPGRS